MERRMDERSSVSARAFGMKKDGPGEPMRRGAPTRL